MSDNLNEGENLIVGACAAVIEGILLQPTLYWKNARAQHLPFTLNLRTIYRGTLASVLNEAQMMGLQFLVTGYFLHIFLHGVGNRKDEHFVSKPLVQNQASAEMLASALGGCIPTFLTCPIELIMIQQQRFGNSFLGTLTKIYQTHGLLQPGLGRGFFGTVGRDTICVMGMLGVTPIIQNKLMTLTKRDIGNTGDDSDAPLMSLGAASLTASIIGGLFAAVPSHPFDAVKTCMQGDLKQDIHKSFSQTFSNLYQEGGIRRLYRGCFWRSVNIVATVYVANECRIHFPALLFDK